MVGPGSQQTKHPVPDQFNILITRLRSIAEQPSSGPSDVTASDGSWRVASCELIFQSQVALVGSTHPWEAGKETSNPLIAEKGLFLYGR